MTDGYFNDSFIYFDRFSCSSRYYRKMTRTHKVIITIRKKRERERHEKANDGENKEEFQVSSRSLVPKDPQLFTLTHCKYHAR